jgi:hypothetical protein
MVHPVFEVLVEVAYKSEAELPLALTRMEIWIWMAVLAGRRPERVLVEHQYLLDPEELQGEEGEMQFAAEEGFPGHLNKPYCGVLAHNKPTFWNHP